MRLANLSHIYIYIYIGARGAVVIALPLNHEVAGSIPTGD